MRSDWLVPWAFVVALGCGPAAEGEKVSITQLCKPAMSGKRVSVPGYFTAEGLLTMCSSRGGTKTCSFRLRDSAGNPKPDIGIGLKIGGGESEMQELPEGFKSSDIKIKTVGGKVVGGRAHIQVTGKALVAEQSCQIIDIDRIDAL